MVFDLSVNGERISLLGPAAVIESKSTPGTYRTVYNGTCDCPGFAYRGKCRHVAAVAELRQAASKVTTEVERQAERRATVARINSEIWGFEGGS